MGFNVVLFEGVFSGPHLSAHGASVADVLTDFIGSRVRIAAHHLPSDPIDPTRWGGGSCTYGPGPCPFGHHTDPTRMFSYAGEGVLGRDGAAWTIARFDGTVDRVDLSPLIGHQGRVVAAQVIDLESMRDAVAAAGIGPELGVRADELRQVLERLRGK